MDALQCFLRLKLVRPTTAVIQLGFVAKNLGSSSPAIMQQLSTQMLALMVWALALEYSPLPASEGTISASLRHLAAPVYPVQSAHCAECVGKKTTSNGQPSG